MRGPVRAPGKLFWLGEYVVLDGAPAIVAAVDRELLVFRETTSDDAIEVASELFEEPVKFGLDGTAHTNVPRAAALVATVIEVAAEVGTLAPARLRIDGAALAAGAKLGLGSSGATAAAVAAAVLGADTSDSAVEFVAMQAHHRWQGNVGSGADVLASLHGGLLVIRDGKVEAKIEKPAELEVVVLHTGRAADTRDLVANFQMVAGGEDGSRGVRALLTAAQAGCTALREGNVRDFLDAVADFGEVERRFGALGVRIVTPEIEVAMEIAERCGWVAKPSGAGGGDCIVAFAEAGADRERLTSEATDAGLSPIALDLVPHGALRSR